MILPQMIYKCENCGHIAYTTEIIGNCPACKSNNLKAIGKHSVTVSPLATAGLSEAEKILHKQNVAKASEFAIIDNITNDTNKSSISSAATEIKLTPEEIKIKMDRRRGKIKDDGKAV